MQQPAIFAQILVILTSAEDCNDGELWMCYSVNSLKTQPCPSALKAVLKIRHKPWYRLSEQWSVTWVKTDSSKYPKVKISLCKTFFIYCTCSSGQGFLRFFSDHEVIGDILFQRLARKWQIFCWVRVRRHTFSMAWNRTSGNHPIKTPLPLFILPTFLRIPTVLSVANLRQYFPQKVEKPNTTVLNYFQDIFQCCAGPGAFLTPWTRIRDPE